MIVRFAIASAIVVGTSVFFNTAAQSQRPADAGDAVAALVSELRAVRVDLAQAAERNLRFQLLLARLQLQEQRLGHLDRQRSDVIKSFVDSQTATSLFLTQFEQMERDCSENPDPLERKACAQHLAPMKATVASHQQREQQLRQQEQDLSQAIATEQNRWAEFSARLDELERALSRPR